MNESERLLPPGLSGRLGGIDILGFEIELPGRSSHWLELDNSLNLLYGKNGSGKSSILEALSNFAQRKTFYEPGKLSTQPSARLVFRINQFEQGLVPLIGLLFDRTNIAEDFEPNPKDSPLPLYGLLSFSRPNYADKSEFWSEHFGTQGIPDFAYIRDALQERGDQLFPEQDWGQRITLPGDSEDFEARWVDMASAMICHIIQDEVCPVDKPYGHGWPNWYEQYIQHCIVDNLFDQRIFDKRGFIDHDVIWESKSLKENAGYFGLLTDDKDEWLLSDLSNLMVPEVLVLHFMKLFSKWRSEIKDSSLEKQDQVETLAALTSLGRLFGSNLFTLTPSILDDQQMWTLGVASDDSNLISDLRRLIPQNSRGTYWQNELEDKLSIGTMGKRDYINFDLEIPVYQLPFIVSDLREVPPALKQIEVLSRHVEPGLYSKKIDFEKQKTLLDTLSKTATDFLKGLEINIEAIRVDLSSNLSDWIAGKGSEISVFDRQIDEWIPPSTLSSAQARWVDLSLELAKLSFHTSPLMILLDEPDQGLHVTASKSALQSLSNIGGTVIVATHSISALRLNTGRINHVQRNAAGETYVEKLAATDGQLLSSLKLGVDPLDLLSFKRVAIFVEGFHDEIVLGCLFPDKQDPIHNRMMVIATRGEKQLTNGVDSQLIISFSKMNIIIVADKIRSDFFEEERLKLLKQFRNGETIDQLRKQLRDWNRGVLQKTQKAFIYEERTMVDIFDRALLSDSLHRVRIQGVEKNDILETIPSEYFNLKIPWNSLHDQYAQHRKDLKILKDRGESNSKAKDFKTWVSQNHGVRFTERVIREAFTAAFKKEIPEDLQRLKILILEKSELS